VPFLTVAFSASYFRYNKHHRNKYTEEFEPSILTAFLTTKTVMIQGRPVVVYNNLKGNSDKFFSRMHSDYPWVTGTKKTHHVSSKIAINPVICDGVEVGAKPTKDKVVFTARFDCGFKKAGCVVRFKHIWTLTTKGTAIFEETVVSDSSHHLHLHGIKAATKRKANKKSDGPTCDLLALPSKYQEPPVIDNVFQAQLKPIQRFAGALSTSSLCEIESGNPNACTTSFNSHRKQAEGEQHDKTPWIPDSAWQNSPKPSIDDRVRVRECPLHR